MKHLTTAREVVEHLGGLERVCELTQAKSKTAYNWPTRAKSFPASTYVVMQRALRRRNASAPAHLWNQRGV
ncbi:hypothetical protein [Bradyrhizobium arachidis]|uniref:Uncharacterized protein n=1 Tax=Bradyrhizobium arachidis TaxID=858423 RepID=A0AAE7NP70_9BRAD|nr:hypothetical protein [Bradyrhizobium arachidis]QOZ68856.1 hypothetical protein WN72_22915 [Bradyrhizobium arachidis]SFV19273.1 hypothetical protein SAMN05192541_14821 [Bradyrhizobium arachidis]